MSSLKGDYEFLILLCFSGPQGLPTWVVSECESVNNSVVSLFVTSSRLLCPWNSPGKDAGVGSHSLLQGILSTQGSNLGIQNCRQILYRLSHQGKPNLGDCCSADQLCLTPCDPMDCSMPGFPVFSISGSLLKLMSIESVMLSNHPLLFLPSIFPNIRVFSIESVPYIRCPKFWSFSFSISPSNKHSGLISFKIDWFDLLDIQGTLKSLLQQHNSKKH